MSELHNNHAEQSVIGGLMLRADALDDVEALITPDDFFDARHRDVFSGIMELSAKREPFDPITLAKFFNGSGKNADLAYLGTLAKNTPSAANIESYARIVKNSALRRRVLAVGEEIKDLACSARDSEEVLSEALERLSSVAENGVDSGIEEPKSILRRVIENLDMRFNSKSEIHGMRTGFADLDKMTSGLHPGELIIVAGRPSMGKSTFAENIAENVIGDGGIVLFHSLEMPSDIVMERGVSSLSGVPLSAIRSGRLGDEQWSLISSATSRLSQSQYHIDDTPAVRVARIRSNARRLKRKHSKLDLIVVDYIQLAVGEGERRDLQVGSITQGLKALAKEMKCPVVALSQLSRDVEKRPNKRPMMSDLRESGAIEQDADLILFLYRDEVYNEDSLDKGTAEIGIGKQRNGSLGVVRLIFQGECVRFKNYDWEYSGLEAVG